MNRNRHRDINGRFIVRVQEGFNVFITIWFSLPIILLLVVLGKYFNISQKFSDVMISLACGDHCTCQCTMPKDQW